MRQRNDVTLRDPAHLYPWVDFVYVPVFVWFGKVGRHFLMKNNFLTLIDHFSKTYGTLMLYLPIWSTSQQASVKYSRILITFLARLHEVHRAIVVTSVVPIYV